MIAFYTAINHNYNDNQQTLKMYRNLPVTTDGCDLFEPIEVNFLLIIYLELFLKEPFTVDPPQTDTSRRRTPLISRHLVSHVLSNIQTLHFYLP